MHFEHETHLCEVCAETISEQKVCHISIYTELRSMNTESQRWLQLHLQYCNVWFIIMILRLSSNCCSRSCQIHQGWKKLGKLNFWTIRQWSVVLKLPDMWLNFTGLSTESSLTLWSNHKWEGFETGWWRQFSANIQTTEIGFSTLATCLLTHYSFENSCLPKTLQWLYTLLFTWLLPATYFYSLR